MGSFLGSVFYTRVRSGAKRESSLYAAAAARGGFKIRVLRTHTANYAVVVAIVVAATAFRRRDLCCKFGKSAVNAQVFSWMLTSPLKPATFARSLKEGRERC